MLIFFLGGGVKLQCTTPCKHNTLVTCALYCSRQWRMCLRSNSHSPSYLYCLTTSVTHWGSPDHRYFGTSSTKKTKSCTIPAREHLHFISVVTDWQLVLCHAIQTTLSLIVIKTEVAHWAHTHYTAKYSHHSSSDCLITICTHKHFSHYI